MWVAGVGILCRRHRRRIRIKLQVHMQGNQVQFSKVLAGAPYEFSAAAEEQAGPLGGWWGAREICLDVLQPASKAHHGFQLLQGFYRLPRLAAAAAARDEDIHFLFILGFRHAVASSMAQARCGSSKHYQGGDGVRGTGNLLAVPPQP